MESFLSGMPATSVQALKPGLIEAGILPNEAIGITENLADARGVFLTPNTTVIYQWAFADIEHGPMVIEVPPGVLGIIDDAYFRFVTDMGQFGPDQGKGGKFLLCRGYTGSLPKEGYFSSSRGPTPTSSSFARSRSPGTSPAPSKREGQDPDLSAFGGSQSARAEVREHLGHAVQYRSRQRFQFL